MLTFFVVVGLVIGCQGNGSGSKSASLTSPDVLDVAPTAAPIPADQPVAAQPVADVQPIAYATATPAPTTKTYTIKKGDTLFSIAKSSYGTGRDWQKIASANPGLEPSKLRVGQQIVIP
jgi:nucleoid-associated protein YgaU